MYCTCIGPYGLAFISTMTPSLLPCSALFRLVTHQKARIVNRACLMCHTTIPLRTAQYFRGLTQQSFPAISESLPHNTGGISRESQSQRESEVKRRLLLVIVLFCFVFCLLCPLPPTQNVLKTDPAQSNTQPN